MEITFEQLKHKTIAELREMAKGIQHEAVQGYTQMNKEHLLIAVSKALGIQHEHHEVVGVDKASLKSRIKELKKQRQQAISAHDSKQLKTLRRTMHQTIRAVSDDMDSFGFNTMVAHLMEFVNELMRLKKIRSTSVMPLTQRSWKKPDRA